MPRKRKAVVRVVLPDPKYNDVVLTKFMNCLMKQGKKSIAVICQNCHKETLAPSVTDRCLAEDAGASLAGLAPDSDSSLRGRPATCKAENSLTNPYQC